MSQIATETIVSPADRYGAVVDTGFHVGERVIALIGGHEFERIVLGPPTRSLDCVVYRGRRWQTRTTSEPGLRVAPEGHPDLWVDVPLSRIWPAETQTVEAS